MNQLLAFFRSLDKDKLIKNLLLLVVLKATFFLIYSLVSSNIISFSEKPLTAQSQNVYKDEEVFDNTPKKQRERTAKDELEQLLNIPHSIDPESSDKQTLIEYIKVINRKFSVLSNKYELNKKKEEYLSKLENSIEKKIRALEEEREFFQQTIQKEKKLQEDRLDKLVLFYVKMEPKKAAPLFEKMDKDMAVHLLKSIPEKTIKSILEAMNPDEAVKLSEYFGRVRSAKEYELMKEVNRSLIKEFEECKNIGES